MAMLKPGDEITEISAKEAFDLLTSSSQIRGIDARWNIVDADAFIASLERAGLDELQITALADMDISIDTYVKLKRAEVACIRAFGVEVTDVSVTEDPFTGLSSPGYSVQMSGGGFSEGQTNHVQAFCQNRFTGVYELAYNTRLGPSVESQQEMLIARANAYLSCVRDKGADAPFERIESANIDQFMAWLSTNDTPGCNFRNPLGG